MSIYDNLVDHLHENVDKRNLKESFDRLKGERPLKMPKNYDFSVRNVKWDAYKNDFILRTDAVWEKSKLMDIFYTVYKSKFLYDDITNRYLTADIRNMPLPTTEPEALEEWRVFNGYTDIDGCIWQFKYGPMVQRPNTLSKFVADKEGDTWYICFLSF